MKNSTEKELLLLLHSKIDSVQDDIKSIEVTQAEQHMTLLEHTRRSLAVEEELDVLKLEVKPVLQGLGFLKILAKVGAATVSLIYALSKFLH